MENLLESGRRQFLKTSLAAAVVAGVGTSLVGRITRAADGAMDDGQVSTPGQVKPVTSEALFRKGVIGPAELSRVTSEMAAEKATDKQAKEFATFELTEAIAILSVLKDLGTPMMPMDEMAKMTLASLQSAGKGPQFDKLFMAAQLKNHLFLREHATDYLKLATGKSDPDEKQTQHLATLALATFKEHVTLCQRISSELTG